MELVPIIWNTLLLGSISLLLVLIISYVASKFKKEVPQNYGEMDLIPDRPVFVTRRHENPNIQVTSSRLEKQYIQEKQPKIFDINRKTNEQALSPRMYETETNAEINRNNNSGSRYGGSIHRNPRFTILNNTMTTISTSQRQVNSSNSFRFTDHNFL